MRDVVRDPDSLLVGRDLDLSPLIYGWGNEPWSASEEYLMGCLEAARGASGPILECGSGLSTLLVGVVAQRLGNTVWSLEHDDRMSRRVEEQLARFGITSVRVCCSPLHDYGEFSWYRPPMSALPGGFAIVICDGPPGSTPGGRVGLLPLMRSRLAPGCIVLLDDAEREREREIAAAWAAELHTEPRLHGTSHPYFEIRVPA